MKLSTRARDIAERAWGEGFAGRFHLGQYAVLFQARAAASPDDEELQALNRDVQAAREAVMADPYRKAER